MRFDGCGYFGGAGDELGLKFSGLLEQQLGVAASGETYDLIVAPARHVKRLCAYRAGRTQNRDAFHVGYGITGLGRQRAEPAKEGCRNASLLGIASLNP